MTMLKTLAIAFLLVAAPGVTVAPAFAGDDCKKFQGKFFKDGDKVPKCKHAKAYKAVGGKHEGNFDVCDGAKPGTWHSGTIDGKAVFIRCK